MEKKNNPYVLCAVALFAFAFILTLTHVFHVKIEMLEMTASFGYSGLGEDGIGAAVWAKVLLIILNVAGALFLLGYSMNLIPKFPGSKFVPVACAGLGLLFVIIAWIVVPGAEEFEDMKVAMSFDGWMLLFAEIAACGVSFLALKNEK